MRGEVAGCGALELVAGLGLEVLGRPSDRLDDAEGARLGFALVGGLDDRQVPPRNPRTLQDVEEGHLAVEDLVAATGEQALGTFGEGAADALGTLGQALADPVDIDPAVHAGDQDRLLDGHEHAVQADEPHEVRGHDQAGVADAGVPDEDAALEVADLGVAARSDRPTDVERVAHGHVGHADPRDAVLGVTEHVGEQRRERGVRERRVARGHEGPEHGHPRSRVVLADGRASSPSALVQECESRNGASAARSS